MVWSMTTLSTVGYGDLYPVTFGGRVVAITTMIVGVGVLGTLAATVAAGLIEFRERGRKGLRSHMLKDHLLVLGWNEKSFAAIDDFRHDPRYLEMRICVVADLEAAPIAEPVRFVRGASGASRDARQGLRGRAPPPRSSSPAIPAIRPATMRRP